MKKMLFLVLLAFITNFDYLSAQIPPSLLNAKKAINTAIGAKSENDPMFIITVRRTIQSLTDVRTQLISNNELEQVLRILYASCAGKAAPSPYNGSGNGLSTKSPTIKDAQEILNIDMACQTLKQYYNSKKMNDHSKIIILNEMFFSQIAPLSMVQKNFIENAIKALSSQSNKAVFFVNFLHKETKLAKKVNALQGVQKMKDMLLQDANSHGGFKKMHMFDSNAVTFCNEKINTIFSDGQDHDCNYLLNETYAIWNGASVAQYKKSSYCMESDNDINNGSIYEFGNGLTKKIGDSNPVQNMLINNIIIEICYDLFCGIRKDNQWKHDGAMHNPNNIHVIQSNTINPYNSVVPHDNINRLPLNTGIIHSDPANYSFESLFFVEKPAISDPRSAKNIIYSSKQSISVLFCDSMYTVTIYEI